jgi:hypothetical protein
VCYLTADLRKSSSASSKPPRADQADALASQVHTSASFALLLDCLLLRTCRASAGPCCIRAAG